MTDALEAAISPGRNPRRHGRPLSAREKKVMSLVARGITAPADIAARLNVTRGHARVILCNMRKKGCDIPVTRGGVSVYLKPITVSLDPGIAQDVAAHALKRGMTARALVQQLIVVAAREKLFDAIIDED